MDRPFQTKRAVWVRDWLPYLVSGLVLAASYPVFLEPWVQSASASSRGEAFGELYAERLASMERIGTRLNEQLGRLEEWKRSQGVRVFTAEEAEAFWAQLESAASEAGCRVAAVDVDLAAKEKGILPEGAGAVELRAVKLQMFGSFDAWVRWIRQIETLPHAVLVDSLKIESLKDRRGVLTGRVCLLAAVVREPDCAEPSAIQKSEEK
jgi:hypothetical protein